MNTRITKGVFARTLREREFFIFDSFSAASRSLVSDEQRCSNIDRLSLYEFQMISKSGLHILSLVESVHIKWEVDWRAMTYSEKFHFDSKYRQRRTSRTI